MTFQTHMKPDRIIGRITGRKGGPLLICLGGIHGNEYAGVQAISRFFEEMRTRRAIDFRGALLGLRGNIQALQNGVRFLEKDLNRLMLPETLERINKTPEQIRSPEEREFIELISLIDSELDELRPDRLVILDLHTTSADGGVFSIPADTPESRALALHFHVPLVLGMSGGLDGTSLSFFSPQYRGLPAQVVAFEAGQNEDPQSVQRSLAAILNALKAIGCLEHDHPNPFEKLLLEYANGLPKVSELLCVHLIQPGDGFLMRPGYRNFQIVKKGEHLADDQEGPIRAMADGLILMPLYQAQGSNGFFIVKPAL
jgi:predicted deacylase